MLGLFGWADRAPVITGGLLDGWDESRSKGIGRGRPLDGTVPVPGAVRSAPVPGQRPASGDEGDLLPPGVLALYRERLDADGLDFLKRGPRSPEEQLAFAQRVHPEAYRTAEPLPEREQRRFQERGEIEEHAAFVGPDGIVYQRDEDSGEGPAARIRRGFESAVGGYERPSLRQLFAEGNRQADKVPRRVETDEQPAESEGDASVVFDIGSPTNEIVDADAMLQGLHFDPSGPGEKRTALGMPLDALRAWQLRSDVDDAVRQYFPKLRDAHNNEADAFRHALWSFLVTRNIGLDAAKQIGDAHERYDEGQKQGEQLMDLFNNNVGRRLALDPGNKDRPAEEVVLEALRNGQLQTQSFRLPGSQAPELQWPGLFLKGPYMNRNGY